MKKILIFILLFLNLASVHAMNDRKVFVSFSMPEKLLEQIYHEAQENNVTIVLNGLIGNDMKKTMKKLYQVGLRFKSLSLQIDPVAFEKYKIKSVPALVISDDEVFDVLYGNLSLVDGIKLINQRGELRGTVI